MLFHVLGPFELRGPDGQPVVITAEKQQRLLLALLLRSNTWVAVDDLVDAVWPASPPASAASHVDRYVQHLRRLVPSHPDGSERITSRPGHYRLAVGRAECDATTFEDLAERAAASPDSAVTRYREALALWRGRPFDPLDDDAVREEAARLRQLRWAVRDGLADALLAAGEPADVIALMAPLAAADPGREATWRRLLTAYHQAGRRSDGLVAYERACRHLGAEPSDELQRLHQLLLDDSADAEPAEQDTEDQPESAAPEETPQVEPQKAAGDAVPAQPAVVGASVAGTVGARAAASPTQPARAPRPAGQRLAPPRAARAAATRWWAWAGRHRSVTTFAVTLLVMVVLAISLPGPLPGLAPSQVPRAAPSAVLPDAPTATPSPAGAAGSVAGPPTAAPTRGRARKPEKKAPAPNKRAAPPAAPAAPAGPPQLRFLWPPRGTEVSGWVVIRVQVTNYSRLRQVDFHFLTVRCDDDGGYKKYVGADKTPNSGGVYEIAFDTNRADDGCLHFGAVGLDRYSDRLYPSEGIYVRVAVDN